MSADATLHSRRVLDPAERIFEVLFGLIMVLSFTGSLAVAEAGREDIRDMLIGAVGCNLAWGIIDAVLYLLGCLAERGRNLQILHAVRRGTDPEEARLLIASSVPPLVASLMRREEFASLHERLRQLPEPPARARLNLDDAKGGLGVFLLVFLSTLPVALPFVFMHDARLAMRVSNATAIVMLAIAGAAYGRCIGQSRWLFGFAMVILGFALVTLTIAFGG